MNSSTSSSDRRRRYKVFGVVLFGLILLLSGLEVVTRYLLVPRSRDLARFASYPDRAAELCQKPGLRIAFVGNSATQCGVDPEQFVSRLPNPNGQPIHVDLFLADGSEINTWHYMVNHSFWRAGLKPDWIIVNFIYKGLQDGNDLEIDRLAQFFTSADDWNDLCALDLPDVSRRAEYLLAKHWATFAFRDRIKKRVLNAVIPDYKDFAEGLNRAQLRQDNKHPSSRPVSHRVLQRFLTAAVEQRTKIIFVAFPTNSPGTAEPYAQHLEAQELIKNAGMYWLDLRKVPQLHEELYEDDIHLNKTGAEIYTDHLADAVAPLFATHGEIYATAKTAHLAPR